MPAKILLADDDLTTVDFLLHTLQAEGFEVLVAMDGERALALARSEAPDLVVLDVVMPLLQGFEVCREIRRQSTVPIMMLTARHEEDDRIRGLNIGADDYILKPFSSRELVARIHAHLRRVALSSGAIKVEDQQEDEKKDDVIHIGAITIDRRRHAVSRGAETVSLSQREYGLLQALLDAHGAVIPRSQLLADVWGEQWVGDPRTLDVHIRWLREKLEELPAQPKLVLTVRSVGYRLVTADELDASSEPRA